MVIHMRNGETTLAASYVLIAGGRWVTVGAGGTQVDSDAQCIAHGPCMGIRVNIWERSKARGNLEHYLEGGGVNGYDALRQEKILKGDAGKLGKYDIISFLLDKVARFLYDSLRVS